MENSEYAEGTADRIGSGLAWVVIAAVLALFLWAYIPHFLF